MVIECLLHIAHTTLKIQRLLLFSRKEAIARNIQITALSFSSSGRELGSLCGAFVSLRGLTARQLFHLPVLVAQRGHEPGLGPDCSSKVSGLYSS